MKITVGVSLFNSNHLITGTVFFELFCVPYEHNYTIFDENIIFNFFIL
jgi:hypothetical protein